MRKIFFAVLFCAVLMLSCGAAAAEEEAWVAITSVPQEYNGAPYIFAGSTNLPTGSMLKINITSRVNGVFVSGTTEVFSWQDETRHWRFLDRLTEFPPGLCTVSVTAGPEHPNVSDSAEFSLSDIWIKIDPLPFVAAEMANVTFSGTTTLPAGQEVLVEIVNADATCCGPGNIFGRSAMTTIQNGTDTVRTWNISINTTGLPPKEYIITVYGIGADRTVREYFMIHPAGFTTPGLTNSPSSEDWIKIDPLPFVAAEMTNVTFSGTTTLPAGEKFLVEIMNTGHTTAGLMYERHGVVTIQNGTEGVQTWSFTTNTTTDMPPREYIIKISGIETDKTIWERFMIYPAGYTTPEPTKASGFSIIPILFAATAAVMFMRK